MIFRREILVFDFLGQKIARDGQKEILRMYEKVEF